MLTSLSSPAEPEAELEAFLTRLRARVMEYLGPRQDSPEQLDHLRHVANRARWLYFVEIQRQNPGSPPAISLHDDRLIEACALGHDIGKWVPREVLRALLPADRAGLLPIVRELRLLPNQIDLLQLGVRRRLALPQDGYSPEYDAAHHLVSALILTADAGLGFHHLSLGDQEHLIDAIIGHQFGSYFKERLFQISLHDRAVTTGMLVDVSRPELLAGDWLACAFHDADIADLLYVGSLEHRPGREDYLHAGGLVKILLINFMTTVHHVPDAPNTYEDCLRSCQLTVTSVGREFLTATAIEHGRKWRHQANRFLDTLREPETAERFKSVLYDQAQPPAERLAALRLLTHHHARRFVDALRQEA
ncbi:MAG: hypothetical protein JNK29_15240 [Anaerolineales bacterium]|nr:hypothetical protein [Anaerolineales bacterium]